ncbi:MAG TPA: DNA polymerase III subunit gamma/tau [Anaeromyxobacteraceae bacterium]|nr:DNA polymerase III subunit gamma/tau [Anaeromyxobacteraceae bacterium]
MSYLVLARKYRPQSFAEMAGQEHVVRTLTNALKSGHLAHAFLFTGPRGVGKTTAARLVAKSLNCVKGPTAEPCGACPPCLEIAEGRSVDVVEIDAASNNGVDNVRDIVEAVKYRPARDRFKVFVVDEVHMLSTGAFNALLKTLEEPPEHVKFVLATTDVHKVPETIVSRCQRFDFRRLTLKQIVEQLGRVAKREGLQVSEGALSSLARAAEGGMRDALSLLDQVRAACGDAADDAAVAEAVGTVDAGAVARLASALIGRDGAAVLLEVAALHARGLEMKRTGEELVRHLRNVVVAKLVPAAPLDLPDAEREAVLAQAAAAPAAQLARLFDLAQRAVTEVKASEQPRYALEVALLRACYLAPGAEVTELLARLEALGGGPRSPGAAGGSRTLGGSPPAGAPGPSGPSTRAGAPAPAVRAPPAEPASALPVTPSPEPRDDPSRETAERWRAAVAAVERATSSAGRALKQAVLVELGDREIALRMPPGMAYSTLERRRGEVEAIFSRFFGREVKIALRPGEAAAGTASGGPLPESLAATELAERDARSAEVRAAARTHPNIQEAARVLEGEIVKVDEL